MTNSTDQFDTALDPQKSYPTALSAGQGTCPADGRPATSQEQERSDLLQRQEAIVAMGRRAIAPPDLPILMQDGADLLAEMLGMEYGLVAERSPDGQSPQLRMALRSAISNCADSTEPETPTCATSTVGTASLAGYALQIALPVVVADLSGEKRFVDDFLRNHGIRSAIAVPLKLQDRSFGSLAACSSRIRDFNDEDLLFAETIAHLVTTALGRARAERSLADERRLRAGVLQTVDALVLVLDGQRQIVSINPACERLTGFSLQEIKGRQLWSVLSVAEEAEMCRRLLDQLQEKKAPVEYESWLLTKHSQKRRIAWTCDVIADDDGTPESIIATGVDVTRQREAEEKAERAEQAAQQARQAMARALQATQSGSAPSAEAPPVDGGQAEGGSGSLPPSAYIERRGHPRRPFLYKQRIAAVIDGKLPDRQTFTDVQCRDIAASGFSFVSPTPPASDTLVVALGAPPRVTYLVAQIVHVTRVEKRGQQKYLIGCHYVGRAAY